MRSKLQSHFYRICFCILLEKAHEPSLHCCLVHAPATAWHAAAAMAPAGSGGGGGGAAAAADDDDDDDADAAAAMEPAGICVAVVSHQEHDGQLGVPGIPPLALCRSLVCVLLCTHGAWIAGGRSPSLQTAVRCAARNGTPEPDTSSSIFRPMDLDPGVDECVPHHGGSGGSHFNTERKDTHKHQHTRESLRHRSMVVSSPDHNALLVRHSTAGKARPIRNDFNYSEDCEIRSNHRPGKKVVD